MNKQHIATFQTVDAALAFLAQLALEVSLPTFGYYLEASTSVTNSATAMRQWYVGKLA